DGHLRRQYRRWLAGETYAGCAVMIRTHSAEIEAALVRLQERRIRRQQDLAHRVRKAVMQPARHAVPKGAQVLGVSAAQVLRRADILRRLEASEEVIVLRAEERPVAINGRFADDARLVDVVILERIVNRAVGHLVAVVMA